jgi:uncharacterized protein (DUF1697 family)
VIKLSGYKKAVFNANDLWAYTDSVVHNKPVPAKTSIRPNTVLFSFTKKNITANNWIDYRKSIEGDDNFINEDQVLN